MAYINPSAVRTAIERGEFTEEAAQQRAERAEGLVSYQQSSGPVPGPARPRGRPLPSAEKLERLDKLRAAREVESDGRKRYRFTIASANEVFTIDSEAARLRRCQRRVRAWSEALPRQNRTIRRAGRKLQIGPRTVMLTLTYEDAEGWEPNHIRDFMKRLRAELGDRLYGYAWVLEMQERGAPHYHVLLYVKAKTDVPKPDEAGLWTHGSSRRETARNPWYIVKYTGKEYQKKDLPKGARMFAVQIYQGVLSPEELLPFRLSAAPAWLRPFIAEAVELVGATLRWTRAKGGGWLIRDTGEVIASPWELVGIEEY